MPSPTPEQVKSGIQEWLRNALRARAAGQNLGAGAEQYLDHYIKNEPQAVAEAQAALGQPTQPTQPGGLGAPGLAPRRPGSTFQPPPASGGMNYEETVRRYGQQEADRIWAATGGVTTQPQLGRQMQLPVQPTQPVQPGGFGAPGVGPTEPGGVVGAPGGAPQVRGRQFIQPPQMPAPQPMPGPTQPGGFGAPGGAPTQPVAPGGLGAPGVGGAPQVGRQMQLPVQPTQPGGYGAPSVAPRRPGSTFQQPPASGGINYEETVRRYGQQEADRIWAATGGVTTQPQHGRQMQLPVQPTQPGGLGAPGLAPRRPGSTFQPPIYTGGGQPPTDVGVGLPQEPGVTRNAAGTLIGGGEPIRQPMIPTRAPTGPVGAPGAPGGIAAARPSSGIYGTAGQTTPYQQYQQALTRQQPGGSQPTFEDWQGQQRLAAAPRPPTPAYQGPGGPVTRMPQVARPPTVRPPTTTWQKPGSFTLRQGTPRPASQQTPGSQALTQWASNLLNHGQQWSPRTTAQVRASARAPTQPGGLGAPSVAPRRPGSTFQPPAASGGFNYEEMVRRYGPDEANRIMGQTGGINPPPQLSGGLPLGGGFGGQGGAGVPASAGGINPAMQDALAGMQLPAEDEALGNLGNQAGDLWRDFMNQGAPSVAPAQGMGALPPGMESAMPMNPGGMVPWSPDPNYAGGISPQAAAFYNQARDYLRGPPGAGGTVPWSPQAGAFYDRARDYLGGGPGPGAPDVTGNVMGNPAASATRFYGDYSQTPGIMPDTGGGVPAQNYGGAMPPPQQFGDFVPGYGTPPNWGTPGMGGDGGPGGMGYQPYTPEMPPTDMYYGGGMGGPGMPPYAGGGGPPITGGGGVNPPAPPPPPPAPEVNVPEMPEYPEAWEPGAVGQDFLDFLKGNQPAGDLGTSLNYLPGVTPPGEVAAQPTGNEYMTNLGNLGGLQGVSEAAQQAVLGNLAGTTPAMSQQERDLLLSQSRDVLQREASASQRALGGALASRGMARGGAMGGGLTSIELGRQAGMGEALRGVNLEQMQRQQARYTQALGMAPQMYQFQQQQNIAQGQAQLDEWFKRQQTALQTAQQTFVQRLSGAEVGIAQRAQDITTLQADLQRRIASGELTRDRAQQVLDYGQLLFSAQQQYLDYAGRRQALALQQQAQLSGLYRNYTEDVMAGYLANQGVW